MHYWRCPTSGDCVTTGIREDRLKELTASVMGLAEHDAEAFKAQTEYISVAAGMMLTFHFFDGREEAFSTTPSAKGQHGHRSNEKNSKLPCRANTPKNAVRQ